MQRKPLPITQTTDQNTAEVWSNQRLVNAFSEQRSDITGTEPATAVHVSRTSGLVTWVDGIGGNIRGQTKLGEDLYIVSGSEMFLVRVSGALTTMAGSIPGTGLVEMAANRTQVCAVRSDTGQGYVLDSTDLTPTVVEITDPAYRPSVAVTVMDGFGIFVERNSGVYFISANEDFSTFDALEFAEAEKEPDNLVTAVSDHAELWLMGQNTIEVWFNSGGDFPFTRMGSGLIERGIAGVRAVTKEDNTVFWLGDDRICYRADGYRPEAISSDGINDEIDEMTFVSDCTCSSWTEKGHKFISYTFPSEGRSFVYDAVTRRWHERMTGADPYNPLTHSGVVTKLGKYNVIVQMSGSSILRIAPAVYDDDGNPLMFLMTMPPVYAGGQTIRAGAFELLCKTGVGLATGQGSDPQLMLRWSDDGGLTWSNEHWRSLGVQGARAQRLRWNRQGSFKHRTYEIRVTDPVPVEIIGASLMVEAGID